MRIIATLLAALLLFSGCTSDPEPKEPKKSNTTSAPSVALPSIPAEAQNGTDEGSVAFIEHYVDVFNYASNTGDVKPLQALSDPKCKGCTSYIALYEETYGDGGFFKNSDWVLSDPKAQLQGKTVVVFAHIDAPSGTYKESKSSREMPGDSEDFDVVFVPAWQDGRWVLTEIGESDK